MENVCGLPRIYKSGMKLESDDDILYTGVYIGVSLSGGTPK